MARVHHHYPQTTRPPPEHLVYMHSAPHPRRQGPGSKKKNTGTSVVAPALTARRSDGTGTLARLLPWTKRLCITWPCCMCGQQNHSATNRIRHPPFCWQFWQKAERLATVTV